MTDVVPSELPPARPWQKEPVPNLTGTPAAFRPAGALERGGNRAAATGDYEAWSPN
jgi:NADH:ubiquinone oxidoreductase subunit